MAPLKYAAWRLPNADPNAESLTLQHLSWEPMGPALCGFMPPEGSAPEPVMQPLCRKCQKLSAIKGA